MVLTLADLATVAGFLLISSLVYLLGLFVTQVQRDRIRERLLDGPEGEPSGWRGALRRMLLPAAAMIVPMELRHNQKLTALEQELLRAGWYRPYAKAGFLAVRRFLILGLIVALCAIIVIFGPERHPIVVTALKAGFLAIALVWAVPRLYLRTVGQQRVRRIRNALPDALDLLGMCLAGGLPLPDSLNHVRREIAFAHPDLATELLILQRQSDLRSSEFAFQQFAKRIDVQEIAALSALVTQGQRLGTDVVGSIREYADAMRLRRRQSADERSNKAGVKMLFPLTLCLLPSVFIILWGPSILELLVFMRQFQGSR